LRDIIGSGGAMRYIWQHPEWPHFQYEISLEIQDILYQYALETGALSDQLDASSHEDAVIELMIAEAISTFRIEGEILNPEDVRSSIYRQLGLSNSSQNAKDDPGAVGIAQLVTSVRDTFNDPLSERQLFDWHRMVMGNAIRLSSSSIGKWRTGREPMQVVSGPIGKEHVHFEAPPSDAVPQKMARFIQWFNNSHPMTGSLKMAGPVRAAITHLYFECIHPFEDGNGRIGRALSEKALSQELQRPVALSLSSAIYRNRQRYYQHLSKASYEQINITPWIGYFVNVVYEAQKLAKDQILFVLQKTQLWKRYGTTLNPRQTRAIQRMLQAGIDGFEGGMNARKYMKIADCSKATATRDLADLVLKGCLSPLPGSGRSARYALVLGSLTSP